MQWWDTNGRILGKRHQEYETIRHQVNERHLKVAMIFQKKKTTFDPWVNVLTMIQSKQHQLINPIAKFYVWRFLRHFGTQVCVTSLWAPCAHLTPTSQKVWKGRASHVPAPSAGWKTGIGRIGDRWHKESHQCIASRCCLLYPFACLEIHEPHRKTEKRHGSTNPTL